MTSKIAVLKDERTLVWVFGWMCVALCVLYIFFMNETVFNVAKRAVLEQEIAVHVSEISDLEFKYISLRNDIDIDLAYSLGYQDIQSPKYISKTPVTALVSFNTIQ